MLYWLIAHIYMTEYYTSRRFLSHTHTFVYSLHLKKKNELFM